MKYKLLGPHVLSGGERLEEGTEVGDDTGYPWKYPDGKDMDPTPQMEGLDDQSREKVREVHRKLYGVGPHWENQNEEVVKAREKEAEEQKKLDEGSEPVSPQQKAERKWEEEDREGKRGEASIAPTIPPRPVTTPPGAARQPSHTSVASPTRGGSTTPAPGPATSKPPKEEDIRPSKPNEEQYPKG